MRKKTIFLRILIYIAIFLLSIIVTFFAINIMLKNQIAKNFSVSSKIDKNLFSRFIKWIENFCQYNGGKIYSHELSMTNQSIASLYFDQFKWTILFTLLVYLLSIILGTTLGIIAGFNYNKAIDQTLSFIVIFLATIPLILIAIIALSMSYIFKYPSQFLNSKYTFSSLFVPILITAFETISMVFLIARKSTKETITTDYFLFAKSLGFSKKELIFKIVLKNVVIKQLQSLVSFYIVLFSSSLVIERIFSIPGQSLFLTFAFKYGEIDLVLYYFVISLLILFSSKIIISFILDYINPIQQTQIFNASLLKVKKPNKILIKKGVSNA